MSAGHYKADDLKQLLDDVVKETGVQLKTSTVELATYTAERAVHLSGLVADPDFLVAVRAERNALWLKASHTAVENADAAEARVIGVLQGALTMTARLIVA